MFTKLHERRVEKLARAVERSKTYDQRRVLNVGQTDAHPCGSPGCLIGHAGVVFRRSSTYQRHSLRNFLFGGWDGGNSLRNFLFGGWDGGNHKADLVRNRDAFGAYGCARAGRSGKKAARFLRKMAADLKAAYAKKA